MKIATLFTDAMTEATVRRTLMREGFETLSSDSLLGVLGAIEQLAAVVIEDDPQWLAEWLAALSGPEGRGVPVFVVGDAARANPADALLRGAADYFFYEEVLRKLVPRLRARVISRSWADAPVLPVGPYCLSERGLVVSCGSRCVRLTPREFALAWALFSHVGRVVSLDTLAARVWGRPGDLCKRTLEQHIYRLRRKLAPLAGTVRIKAAYNIGYRLDLEDDRGGRACGAVSGFARLWYGEVDLELPDGDGIGEPVPVFTGLQGALVDVELP